MIRFQLCLFRATGKGFIHGVYTTLPAAVHVLEGILTTKHPCDPSVSEIAQEFVKVAPWVSVLAPVEADRWWRELDRVSFPAATVRQQVKEILCIK